MKKTLNQLKNQFADKNIAAGAAKELKGGGYHWTVRSGGNLSIGVDCFGICG